MFNVESLEELELINKRAGFLRTQAPVAIRVNPDVDPKTHPYISTGLNKNKFGIDMETAIDGYKMASRLKKHHYRGHGLPYRITDYRIKTFHRRFGKLKGFDQ